MRVAENLPWRRAIPGASGLFACVVAGIAGWILAPAPAPEVDRVVSRALITLPPGERLGLTLTNAAAMSPDGQHLVYVSSKGGAQQLYLRPMESLEPTAIPDTQGAMSPFVTSPHKTQKPSSSASVRTCGRWRGASTFCVASSGCSGLAKIAGCVEMRIYPITVDHAR
jgi:hypothetical protein